MSVTSSEAAATVAAQKNQDFRSRSFADPKLTILRTVTFNKPIPPVSIIFLHPPKTGGTNLVFVAEAMAKINESYKVQRFAVPRLENQSPNRITENWIGGLKAAEAALASNPRHCEDIDFISGHFPFGIHDSITKQCKYVVLIRNPLEQAISSLNFDYQRHYVDEANSKNYLLSPIDNPQTRLLAGIEHMSGACTQAVLNKAKKNIQEHFLLAAVTEDTNAFIQIFASIQNFGPIALCKSQVTGDKVIKDNSPAIDRLYKELADMHHFDLELYEWVRKRWLSWKRNNIKDTTVAIDASDKILCITHQFATTKTPVFKTVAEIEAHNATVADGLVEVLQNHSGLSVSPATAAKVSMTLEARLFSVLIPLFPIQYQKQTTSTTSLQGPLPIIFSYLGQESCSVSSPLGSKKLKSNKSIPNVASASNKPAYTII